MPRAMPTPFFTAGVDAFLARNGNPYSRIGLDARSGVQIALGSSGVPETFVIDGRGVMTTRAAGNDHPGRTPIARATSRSAAPIVPTSAAASSAAMTSAAQICTVWP